MGTFPGGQRKEEMTGWSPPLQSLLFFQHSSPLCGPGTSFGRLLAHPRVADKSCECAQPIKSCSDLPTLGHFEADLLGGVSDSRPMGRSRDWVWVRMFI